MSFDVAFGIFAFLLAVLVVFVIRFAIKLSRLRDDSGLTLREGAYARAKARAEERATGQRVASQPLEGGKPGGSKPGGSKPRGGKPGGSKPR
ncbi:MAG: hypothetical protein ACRDZ5_10390 [Acidimicrobiales bacterium]